MSILAHIYQNLSTLPQARAVHLCYSARLAPVSKSSGTTATASDRNISTSEHLDRNILFLQRIREIVRLQKNGRESILPLNLQLYITNQDSGIGIGGKNDGDLADLTVHNRRISVSDLRRVIGDEGTKDRDGTVCYVCGPPAMTDEFAEALNGILKPEVDEKKRVYYEKWW